MSLSRHKLSPRAIEYLLSVLRRSRGKGYARQYEIIEDLGVSKPTASLMVKKLKRVGYLKVEGEKIMLSEVGERLVRELVRRHGIIESALFELGLSREGACRVAWRIVQEIPAEDAERIWIKLGSPASCPCGYRIPSTHREAGIEGVEPCIAFRASRRTARP
ncbi:MAG: metal-dependent transcriptional regulator [Aigarchaeota archaeon]|nr:metal-dependent transcriptional regulator [Candidatus Wolframiiraptor gerlachensis]